MVFWEGGLFAVDYEEFFEEHECQIQQAAQRAKENVKGLDSSTSTHVNTKGILSTRVKYVQQSAIAILAMGFVTGTYEVADNFNKICMPFRGSFC
jgi:hypothetical protein